MKKPRIETCPECKLGVNYRAMRRHLVLKHRYRYTQTSPNDPVKMPPWKRDRLPDGRFKKFK